MHQRRLIIAATLDALYDANQAPIARRRRPQHRRGARRQARLQPHRDDGPLARRRRASRASWTSTARARSRAGATPASAASSRSRRPTTSASAPYGVAYMTYLGYCDGDVSNLMGTRFYERSQYIAPDDPYPRIQAMLHGANHNWFNSDVVRRRRRLDDRATPAVLDERRRRTPNEHPPAAARTRDNPYTRSGAAGNYGSGDPALMGDQEKAGLAVMGSFFRRYVGSELAFDPYETGELSADGVTPQLPATACPSQTAAGDADLVLRPLPAELLRAAGRAPRRHPARDRPAADAQRARHGAHRQRLQQPVPRGRRRDAAAGDDRGRL